MISKLTFLLTLFLPALLSAQVDSTYYYPDGTYYTIQQFFKKQPGDTLQVRKLNLNVPTSKAFLDTLVDHVWFLNHNHDQIKKIFAIVYHGEIYFQEYGIKQNIMEGYNHRSVTASPAFHRVKVRGRYFYAEATYPYQDPGAAVVGGIFGAVIIGGAVGGAVGAGLMAKNQTLIAPFVFDSKLGKFFVFVFKSKLKEFMERFYPNYPVPKDESRLDTDRVRAFFEELNAKQ